MESALSACASHRTLEAIENAGSGIWNIACAIPEIGADLDQNEEKAKETRMQDEGTEQSHDHSSNIDNRGVEPIGVCHVCELSLETD